MALENNLGLTSSADLAREEERISKKKAAQLFDRKLFDTFDVGTFSCAVYINVSTIVTTKDLRLSRQKRCKIPNYQIVTI